MSQQHPAGENGAAQARIAALEAEVARLRARLADERVADDLRAWLTGAGALGVLGAPSEHDDLLEQIVRTAMHVLAARAGSLYLVDPDSDELIFEVALGESATPLRGVRLPIGQGIAGWVAATGQAIAVADVQRDQRWSREIGRATGYAPKTMLVLPLLLRGDVIGVLQLLDKADGASFGADDMATLGLFARQAAVAIAQSGAVRSLTALLREGLGIAIGNGALDRRAADFVARTERGDDHRDILHLAGLLRRLVQRGEAGRRLSLAIVGAVVDYLDRQVGAEA